MKKYMSAKDIKLNDKELWYMSENNNLRLGLIELYKNKIRYIGFTQKDLDEKYNSKFLSQLSKCPFTLLFIICYIFILKIS